VLYGRTPAMRDPTQRRAGDERGHRVARAPQDRGAARERRDAVLDAGDQSADNAP
jgi:hypothetical protein